MPVGFAGRSCLHGESAPKPEARVPALPQCTRTSRGLEREDHMLMAGLQLAAAPMAQHDPAYLVRPSWVVEMDMSPLSEDTCTKGHGAPLPPSRQWGDWRNVTACVMSMVVSL